MYILQNTLEFK